MGEYRFKLPDIGEGVVEAEITAWHVALGDTVSEDDPIADAMTDKATIELTAPVDGIISMVACEEGDMLAVGADLVIFDVEGDVEGETRAEAPESKSGPAPKAKKVKPPKPQKPKSDKPHKKPLASPAVRKRAKEMGCLLYTSPSPRDKRQSRMPSSA